MVGVAVSRVRKLTAYGKWRLVETGRVFSIVRRCVALHRPQQVFVLDGRYRVAFTPGAQEGDRGGCSISRVGGLIVMFLYGLKL